MRGLATPDGLAREQAGGRRTAGRPTRAAAAALRRSLLKAALDEFLAHGLLAASIEGIARRARVNKDTIYRQFGSKERLYKSAVREVLEAMPKPLERIVNQSGDVEVTLAQAMRTIHRTFTAPRARRIVSMTVTQAGRFPDLAEASRADTQTYLAPLSRYLASLSAQGVLTLDDPHDAAEMLATTALGGVRFLYDPTLRGQALERFVGRRLQFLLRGWRYRPAGNVH